MQKREDFRRKMESLRETPRDAVPRSPHATRMTVRWEILELTTPDISRPMETPAEIRRKSRPASAWPIWRSASMARRRGARITRGRKLAKKMPAKSRSSGIRARKVEGPTTG
jgi:hypothetical protein